MQITKYEHACFTVEKNGQTLIVDPGNFTKSLEIPDNVVAIVITHDHPDHFDPATLDTIYAKNPAAVLVSLAPIVEKVGRPKSQAVSGGDKVVIEPFNLEFFSGEHAEVHPTIPRIDNLGVFIDDKIYYPGDSFLEPGRPVELLALPLSGPWLKLGEVIDFLLAVKPARAFSTHDMHNSEAMRELAKRILEPFAEKVGTKYISIAIGQSLDS